ncbi:MAG TPA: hypothetical protein IAB48_10995 [Candidatus Fimimorpha excrementavium]|nr:hypothetical protein [Candidatus Fimimorpha excrementavium]
MEMTREQLEQQVLDFFELFEKQRQICDLRMNIYYSFETKWCVNIKMMEDEEEIVWVQEVNLDRCLLEACKKMRKYFHNTKKWGDTDGQRK